ncbi:SDR family NAD(P)-dependent oxidoreductase [Streptomyces hainanensis]|uniref:SDR family NAD(P)-dependent oxidoreductase n=1 Tax=Streptomyces hainanensis TaxID=402648 RepID=UPI001404B1F6|nr:SDR family oxidoreductase [Streptomyces hainanensis]
MTGAASGIGRATAKECALAGARVVAVDRNAEGLKETRGMIEQAGAAAPIGEVVADLADHAAVESAVADLAQYEPDHLFHAAGIVIRRDDIEDVTLDDWDTQVAVNQRASWFLTRGFCQQLVARERIGSVVLVSSISGHLGVMSGSWVYASTKAGVTSMTKGFAKTFGPHGIRVNAVAPGLVETPMVRGGVRGQEVDDLINTNVPLRRTADPVEISRASMFLLSDAASFVTGATLEIDGGWLRR